MTLLRCEKDEHTYDNREYTSCPFCRKTQFKTPYGKLEKVNSAQFQDQPTIPLRSSEDLTVPFSDSQTITAPIDHPDASRTMPLDLLLGERTEPIGKLDEAREKGSKQTEEQIHSKTRLLITSTYQEKTSFNTVMPVVGWLVITNGLGIGHCMRILAGTNSIGRERGDLIINFGDLTIARENHAKIIFNPDEDSFFISHLNGFNLTKVNNKVIIENHKLNDYDCIQLGQSELTFISLCSKRFSWKAQMSEEGTINEL
ncbi:MAG: FHA domain-containing protein [Thiolinea sp.]